MGLEVCPLVFLVHFAHLIVVVLIESPLPKADPAPIMFPPVLREAQRGISNSPLLLSLMGWCIRPLRLVMTMHLWALGQECEQVGIFMIFSSHVLPAQRTLSVLGPKL